MKRTNWKLDKGESIVTAWAESCAGPGWANSPVWVLVRSAVGSLRTECLQPDEQDIQIMTLFGVSAASHYAMRRAVDYRMHESSKTKKGKR